MVSSEFQRTLLSLLEQGSIPVPLEGLPGTQVVTDLAGISRTVVTDHTSLAIEAVRLGVHPESVSRVLDWKDFERFVAKVFESFDYEVVHDVRINYSGIRRQIDVVAKSKVFWVGVDCKHWSRSGSLGVAAAKQKERCTILSRMSGVKVVPIIVTLGYKGIVEGVPVVAAYTLRDFVLSLPEYLEDFASFSCS